MRNYCPSFGESIHNRFFINSLILLEINATSIRGSTQHLFACRPIIDGTSFLSSIHEINALSIRRSTRHRFARRPSIDATSFLSSIREINATSIRGSTRHRFARRPSIDGTLQSAAASSRRHTGPRMCQGEERRSGRTKKSILLPGGTTAAQLEEVLMLLITKSACELELEDEDSWTAGTCDEKKRAMIKDKVRDFWGPFLTARAAAWGMGSWAPAEPIPPYGAHMGDPHCGVQAAVVHTGMLPPTMRAHIARPRCAPTLRAHIARPHCGV
jgi:hypothetical protein